MISVLCAAICWRWVAVSVPLGALMRKRSPSADSRISKLRRSEINLLMFIFQSPLVLPLVPLAPSPCVRAKLQLAAPNLPQSAFREMHAALTRHSAPPVPVQPLGRQAANARRDEKSSHDGQSVAG